MDNRKLTLIKYQGTSHFIAGLFLEETEKKHYFGFMQTETPSIIFNNEGDYSTDHLGARITFVNRYQATFEARGKVFGKYDNKLFYLIPIKPEEFDSMYRLLECIYNE